MINVESQASAITYAVRAGLTTLLAATLAACTPPPLRTGAPSIWQASPNFDERRPNFVIIHHTGEGNADAALRALTDPLRAVSAHYLVTREGKVYQLVDERKRAWHAGKSLWGSDADLNSSSIGVEHDNDGEEAFADRQVSALLALLADIRERYRIPAANFLGHADVAPRRKADPSRRFPWRTLAEHGFGLWCDALPSESPPIFDAVVALQVLGYDVSDPDAAILAFKLHYAQDDVTSDLRDGDLRLLTCLVQRKTQQ